MPEQRESDARDTGPVERNRLKALVVVGIGIGVAYAAPQILRLNRVEAHQNTPTHCAEHAGTPSEPQHCPGL